jgi:hypothetical protein
MSENQVRNNSMRVNGIDYFRVGSEFALLGAVGELRTPITKGNYLEVKDYISANKLKIREIGPIKIDNEKVDKKSFLANINVLKVFKGASVDTQFEAFKRQELELMVVHVATNDMVNAINRSPKIREDLQRWGNDARVVTTGFVIVKAETSRKFQSATEVEANITVKGVTLNPKFTSSGSGTTEVEFPVGAFFAYGPSKLIWNHANEKKATEVVDLKLDRHGL